MRPAMGQIKVINEVLEQWIDVGQGATAHAQVIVMIPINNADRLAEHYRQRTEAGSDILADEAKEAARPILAALAAAGFGGGE